jgi:hypothetical protein
VIEKSESPFKEYSADISDAIRSGEGSLGVISVLREIVSEENLPSGSISSAVKGKHLDGLLAKGKSGYAADEVTLAFSWMDFRVQIDSCGDMKVREKYSKEEYVERRVGELTTELKKAGAELREKHGDEVIEDVIKEVEKLESEDADVTAELLRTMTDI